MQCKCSCYYKYVQSTTPAGQHLVDSTEQMSNQFVMSVTFSQTDWWSITEFLLLTHRDMSSQFSALISFIMITCRIHTKLQFTCATHYYTR